MGKTNRHAEVLRAVADLLDTAGVDRVSVSVYATLHGDMWADVHLGIHTSSTPDSADRVAALAAFQAVLGGEYTTYTGLSGVSVDGRVGGVRVVVHANEVALSDVPDAVFRP